jgi:hypothetical protein
MSTSKQPPRKKSTTRRSTRSVGDTIVGQMIFSAPVLGLANRLRQRAANLKALRPKDELVDFLESIAAELCDAVQEGRKNEWMGVEEFRQLVGMEADTVRKHCNAGKIAPARKVGGVWAIHRSAIELSTQTEAA